MWVKTYNGTLVNFDHVQFIRIAERTIVTAPETWYLEATMVDGDTMRLSEYVGLLDAQKALPQIFELLQP